MKTISYAEQAPLDRLPSPGSLRKRAFLVIGLLCLGLALLLLLSAVVYAAPAAAPDGATVTAYRSVPGRVLWAGPLYCGRQHVSFTRSDTHGWTVLTVRVPGRRYRAGQSIWVHTNGGRAGVSYPRLTCPPGR